MTAIADLRRVRRSAARVVRTKYPAFLFGGRVPPHEVPVFTYHEVEARTLAADLAFLLANGYRTLGLEEFHERCSSATGMRDKCVLLTFDDARRNFWEEALPVLEERGARAALFVPSYWIGRRSDGEPPGFMTWEQLRACERSKLVDVESHAHRHVLVSTSPRLVGFTSPAALARHDLFDWPMRRERSGDACGRPPLGSPIYESAPLLSAHRRFVESPAAAQACRALVAAEGGARFFSRRSARAELRSVHDSAEEGELVSTRETSEGAEAELSLAFDTFARELGRSPRYFAFPWMLGSEASIARLAEQGIEAAFGVALDFRRARSMWRLLPVYGRYKSDWLQFLPGRGRRSLKEVVPQKLTTFITTQHLAH